MRKKVAALLMILFASLAFTSALTLGTKVWAVAEAGKALSFNGTSDYVSVPPIDTSTYTFELWFKPDVNSALIGSDRFLIQSSDQSLTIWHNVYVGPCNWFPAPIGTGNWHHLAVIIDYTSWQITPYLDGVSLGTKSTTTTTEPTISWMKIGSYANSRFFDGIIDEVRIYNKALLPADILAHYNSGVGQYGRPEPGLVAGWHFDEGIGTTANDYSGNPNTGTVNGADWVDGHVLLPDVAITSVTTSATKVVSGNSVDVHVTAKNLGTQNESFPVSAYYGNNVIGTTPVTDLAQGATRDLTFSWSTTGVPLGTYAIKANASIVQGETSTADNEKPDGSVWIVQYPIASFTYTPPIENESTTFDATASDPRGGSIVNYTWTFDDGNTTTTINKVITHVYALHGTYNVTLKVWDSEDLSNSTWQIVEVLRHDVAVIDITPYRNWVYEGRAININVTVANFGNFTETATVKLYYNITAGSEIGTKTVTLDPDETKTLTFAWNTTGVPNRQNYTITAVITPSGFDSNTTNNLLNYSQIKVRILGDINDDDQIDVKDIYAVSKAYGAVPTSPKWNPDADINDDGIIDIKDFYTISRSYGK